MRLIYSRGVGEQKFLTLVEAKILPIKLINGVGSFTSASSKTEYADVAIVENVIHRDAFAGKIVALKLSLEEIRDTKPLLLAMVLKDRDEIDSRWKDCSNSGVPKAIYILQ